MNADTRQINEGGGCIDFVIFICNQAADLSSILTLFDKTQVLLGPAGEAVRT